MAVGLLRGGNMKKIDIGNSGVMGSEISLGVMRMDKLTTKEAAGVLNASINAGINFFDHADIYGGGKSEEIFSAGLKEAGIQRDDVIIQTKCGIRPRDGYAFYDFSKEHILNSVDGSLKRLDTDYVDFLLLHRPDTLMEPEEIAAAFDKLKTSGKVKHFGVSNFTPMQIELLQKSLDIKLVANQMQFGPMHTTMIDRGFHANVESPLGIDRTGDILEYCRLHNITIQAWSPFAFKNTWTIFLDDPKHPEMNSCLDKLAKKYGVSKNAVATAWILRHPAKMQVVIGSMNEGRIGEIAKGCDIEMSREEWYQVYFAAGNTLP